MPESSLIASMPDVFVELDNRGKVLKYLGGGSNDAVLRPETMVDKRISDLWSPDAAKKTLRNVRRALESRDELSFKVNLEQDGRRHRYNIRLIVRGFNRVLAIMRSAEIPETETTDAHRAPHVDTVTGLPKEAAFDEQLELMLADARLRERGLAVVAMDLEGINGINRSIGREVGDKLLRECAQRVQRQLRGTDTFTRLGTDEFILAIADVDSRDSANGLGNRLEAAFGDPFNVDGHDIALQPNLGIALFPLDGADAATLQANARVALHEACIAGSDGHTFYSSTMRYRVNQRLDAKEELRWAIDEEQLRLRYQPRFQLGNDKVVGLEALLRWQHPIRGERLPDEFIELAQAGGLMPDLGRWAIREACQHAANWQRDGIRLAVSVNVTEAEFSHPQFVEVVGDALTSTGLDPELLQIEVTERMLMSHQRAYAITHKVSELGARLVIDQFGQGYSSASRLIRFPIFSVKLSQDLLTPIGKDPQGSSLCAGLLAMAHELGWETVAVGVEHRAQLDWLRERGCKSVQGYFLSVPLAADDVGDFMASLRDPENVDNVVDMPFTTTVAGGA